MRLGLRARTASWVAALWAGAMFAIGLIAAPAGFALVSPDLAGRIAGRMFAQEAYLSLGVLVLLLVLWSRERHHPPASPHRPAAKLELALILGALALTAGYFVLQPLLASARAGRLALSFGALHGVSVALFILKAVVLAALAWRLTA